MIIVSGIIGAACGLTFGLFDIEDALGWEFIQLFVLEMGITMLVGAFVGFVGGLINEYLRQSVKCFKNKEYLTESMNRAENSNSRNWTTSKKKSNLITLI